MTNCPCCTNQLLRHIRHNQVYWFCRNCWQEMPSLEFGQEKLLSVSLSMQLSLLEKPQSLTKV